MNVPGKSVPRVCAVCGSKTTATYREVYDDGSSGRNAAPRVYRELYAEHSAPLGPRCAASDRPVTVVTPADGIERALLAASEQLHRVRFERGLAERMTASARARNRTVTTAILCAVFALAGLAAGLALRDRKPASVAPSEAQRVPRRVDARVFLTPDAGPVQ